MKAQFNALDKDSSSAFSSTIVFNDEPELMAAWNEFKSSVPFARWYPDNVYTEDEGNSDSYFRGLVEEGLE